MIATSFLPFILVERNVLRKKVDNPHLPDKLFTGGRGLSTKSQFY